MQLNALGQLGDELLRFPPEAFRIVYLVLGAAVVASVLAYVAMKAWLQNFAFRAGISPLIFVAAALAGLAIAYLTVALQSMKAARAHPVKSLRYE